MDTISWKSIVPLYGITELQGYSEADIASLPPKLAGGEAGHPLSKRPGQSGRGHRGRRERLHAVWGGV